MSAVNGWAVANCNGHIILPAFRRRVDTIKQWVGPEEGWRNRWRWWKRNGCRIIPVTITAKDPQP